MNREEVFLRYRLENNAPVDLLDFTQSLQALQGEYTRYLKERGRTQSSTRLNIQKVEEGSIIFELIEATLPTALAIAGGTNTLVEFGTYLCKFAKSLITGDTIPADGYNRESLDNIAKFIQPLVSNPHSKLEVNVYYGDFSYHDCTFSATSTEGNALQNRANAAKEQLKEETDRTKETKTHVLLRLAQLNREMESKHDRGIIEEFGASKPKKLLLDDEVKSWFMDSDENVFKRLYYVDATALYQEGKIQAYRITKVYESFDLED